nr:unnamed protein product [Callosobruchus analis]
MFNIGLLIQIKEKDVKGLHVSIDLLNSYLPEVGYLANLSLRGWAVKEYYYTPTGQSNIRLHTSAICLTKDKSAITLITDLLNIIRTQGIDLPKDPRTSVKNAKKY